MSWGQIFPGLDDPVAGNPASYDDAATNAKDLTDKTQSVSTEFGDIVSGKANDQVRGASADKLGELISKLDGSFDELPGVFTTLNTIFSGHAEKLRALQTSADQALARATTRWHAVQDAENAHQKSNGRLNSINRQIDRLMSQPPSDSVDQQLQQMTAKRSSASSALANAAGSIKSAKADLERSREEHIQLGKDEQALIEETAQKIKQVDLGDLHDPNRLRQLYEEAVDWVVATGEFLLDAWNYIGDHFMNFLWRLSDILGVVAEILGVLAAVFAVLSVIPVLAPFTAPIAAFLGNAALAVTAVKIAIDLVLAWTGAPHPDTGKTMSFKTVIVEAAVAAGAYFGGKGLTKLATSAAVSGVVPAATQSVDDVVRTGQMAAPLAKNVVAWTAYTGAVRQGVAAGAVLELALEDKLNEVMPGVVDTADTHIVRPVIDAGIPGVVKALDPTAPIIPLVVLTMPAGVVGKVEFGRSSINKVRRFGPNTNATTAAFQLVGVS